MLSIFVRSFLLILLMEFGSSSQFMLFALSGHSEHPRIILAAAILAQLLACFMAVYLGVHFAKFEHSNLVAGVILLTMGVFFLWKS